MTDISPTLDSAQANIAETSSEPLKAITIHETYLDLLAFYDKQIQEGTIKFNPWQVETNDFICNAEATSQFPLKYCLCAANGSGKDSFFVAPFAVWIILSNIKATVVITSSSGPQLTNQTERYIRDLCNKINAHWQSKIFKVNQRSIKCLLSGSEIILFATDEAGRAEGYHPLEPGRKLVLIANECKSIKDVIFQALSRCTGYTHYIMVSSPAEMKGDFYYAFTHWPHVKRVTSYDCPENLFEEDRKADAIQYGISSAWYRSKHLAEFTNVDGTYVISEDVWDKNLLLCKTWYGSKWPKRVGLDLAAGGDESVISIWQGNKQVYQYCFVEKDTTRTVEIITRELLGQGIPMDSPYIKADDGGVGRSIIDQLKRKGWVNLRRVMNQSPPFNKREHGNKGAEMWFNMARLFQECLVYFDTTTKPVDPKLKAQLVSRRYKQTTGGNNRTYLVEKREAKAEGHPSPDRADAMALALDDVNVQMFLELAPDYKIPIGASAKGELRDLQDYIKDVDEGRFKYYDEMSLGNFANAELLKLAACNSDLQPILASQHSYDFIKRQADGTLTKQTINGSLEMALANQQEQDKI